MTALLLANLLIMSFFLGTKTPRPALYLYLMGALAILIVIVITGSDVYRHPTPVSIAGILGAAVLFVAAIANALKRVGDRTEEKLGD